MIKKGVHSIPINKIQKQFMLLYMPLLSRHNNNTSQETLKINVWDQKIYYSYNFRFKFRDY